MLMTRDEVARKIEGGATLYLAGDEALLATLPRGKWIGGTIPYFMDGDDGGTHRRDRIFVKSEEAGATDVSIRWYPPDRLADLAADSPDNGFTIVIIPATSPAHARYAQEAPEYPGLFFKNIIGWVAGVDLADLGKAQPKVFNGATGESSAENAIALHAALPQNKLASIGIVNCFTQGGGDTLTFPRDGFEVDACWVNGRETNFARYLAEIGADTRLPLVADYNGEMVNVSFQNADAEKGRVTLYAPVFANVEYRLAAGVDDYIEKFRQRIPAGIASPEFSCNCILNYLYSELEGKKTGSLVGPITFGEIAYQLLNQTLVYLRVDDAPGFVV